MTIEQVASHVADVLRRAESLFAEPQEFPPGVTAGLHDAASTGEGITARTEGLSGALSAAYDSHVTAATDRLRSAAQSDAQLGAQLQDVAAGHLAATSAARQLRVRAEQVCGELHTPRGGAGLTDDLATLKMLRSQVAAMQRLIADHTETAEGVAAQIRDLTYRDS